MPTIQEQFFDIGANLTHESFEADLDDVISKAQESGVKRFSITERNSEINIIFFNEKTTKKIFNSS